MNPDEHADYVSKLFALGMKRKYILGQEKHGGDITRKNLFPHLMEEVYDMAVYVEVIMDKMDMLNDLLCDAIEFKDWDIIIRALNLLCVGNVDGVEEEEKEGLKL